MDKNMNLIHKAIAFSLMLLLGACTQNEALPNHQQPNAKEASMNYSQNQRTTPAAIPAIDAAAPTLFETATFGLG